MYTRTRCVCVYDNKMAIQGAYGGGGIKANGMAGATNHPGVLANAGMHALQSQPSALQSMAGGETGRQTDRQASRQTDMHALQAQSSALQCMHNGSY